MRVVVFIDLLVSVVEWSSARRKFRERRVMVTRTRCNFFGANDDRFGYNTSQSNRRFGIAPYLEQLNETKKPGSVWCVRACRLRARVQLS
jgi:hypothetical protein